MARRPFALQSLNNLFEPCSVRSPSRGIHRSRSLGDERTSMSTAEQWAASPNIPYSARAAFSEFTPTSPFPGVEAPKLEFSDNIPLKQRVKMGNVLGKGEFGTVYLAIDTYTGALMAVKEVTSSAGPIGFEAMNNELDVYRKIIHRNIVTTYGFDESEGCSRIYMEYVPGGTVTSLIWRFGRLHESIARKYTRDLVTGLAVLHEKGVVHRDVKCSNLLVSTDGTVKISDFGICHHHDKSEKGENRSRSGSFVRAGTPRYMAPEAMLGKACLASDIWSVGCVVSEMVTGELPWTHLGCLPNVAIVYHVMHLSGDDDTPSIPTHLSQHAQDFMRMCFRRDANHRPTPAELLQHPFLTLDTYEAAQCEEIDAWIFDKIQGSVRKETFDNNTTSHDLDDSDDCRSLDKISAGLRRLSQQLKRNSVANGASLPFPASASKLSSQQLCEESKSDVIHTTLSRERFPSQKLSSKELDLINARRIIFQKRFEFSALLREYIPSFVCTNKKIVYDRTAHTASPQAANCVIRMSRWREVLLPYSISSRSPDYQMVEGAFNYSSEHHFTNGAVQWYMNFASEKIFKNCFEDIMRQDEMQVLEHPILYSVRRYFDQHSTENEYTRNEKGFTPVLFSGVPRLCKLHFLSDAHTGKPHGLYGGKYFAIAKREVIEGSVELVNTSYTNIISIESPSGGSLQVSIPDIQRSLISIVTSFTAARLESENILAGKTIPDKSEATPTLSEWSPARGPGACGDSPQMAPWASPPSRHPAVVVHTGNWASVSFGRRVLPILIQLVAARIARIDRLVFYSFAPAFADAFTTALEILNSRIIPSIVFRERERALERTVICRSSAPKSTTHRLRRLNSMGCDALDTSGFEATEEPACPETSDEQRQADLLEADTETVRCESPRVEDSDVSSDDDEWEVEIPIDSLVHELYVVGCENID